MNTHEQQLLEGFLARLASAHGVAKDAQAERMIQQGFAAQPDAAYLLVQRAMLLEQALEQAQQKITQLQAAAAEREARDAGANSFLRAGIPAGFGRAPTSPGLSSPAESTPLPPLPPIPTAAPVAAAPAPGWRERWFGGQAAPAVPQAAASNGGSSFLGTAAASAAGVAGGMFLYNGLSHMLGSQQGGGLFGGGSPVVQERVTENITQNIYEDSRGGAGRSDSLLADNATDPNSGIWDDMSAGLDDTWSDNDLTI